MVKSTLRDALVLAERSRSLSLAFSAWALRRSSGNPDPAAVYRALADRVSHEAESGPRAVP